MPIQYDLVGRNIRALRKKKKLTQKQLADILGCSTEHFCLLESGARHIQLDTLNALCEALQVSYEDVLRGAIDAVIYNGENPIQNMEPGEKFNMMVNGYSEEKVNDLLDICLAILRMPNN